MHWIVRDGSGAHDLESGKAYAHYDFTSCVLLLNSITNTAIRKRYRPGAVDHESLDSRG